MSEPSLPMDDPQAAMPDFTKFLLDWQVQKFEFFEVEYTDKGDDIVYHFWPKNDETWFLPGRPPEIFGMTLEEAFKSVLPEDADVRADYMTPQEALVLMRYGEDEAKPALPRETYSVRVVGYANNLMADKFLKAKVFQELDKAVARRLV